MAEVDPSYVPHDEEQIQEPDNLEMRLELGFEKNLGENLEQHLEHELKQNLEQSLEENSGKMAEQNFGQDLEQNLEQDLDQSLDQNHGQSLEQSSEQDLQHNSEQDPQLQQEQEHRDDTVAEGTEKRWPGWPGESVFRMLVPAQKVGSIIGRKGEFIKRIVEETRARIKILDGPPGTAERAVMVSAKEEPNSSLPPAMDGLLRVHKRVVDGLDSDGSHAAPAAGMKVSTRLLVPASQAGSLIGKQGATVKSIQEASNCIVRVLGAEDLPIFALQEDRVVEVVGDPVGVHKAVELIASHLRKFLVDRSIIPLFEMHMQMPNQQMDQLPPHGPPHQSWGPPQGVPPHSYGGPGYAHNPQYMPPPRQLDNFYPSADMPLPMEKQPHQGISAYGREAPVNVPSAAQSAPSMVTQVTKQMQIPLSYADAVIGTAGASISYIRRASGATVTIQESRGAPGEMTVEISGTASHVQAAEQLIQVKPKQKLDEKLKEKERSEEELVALEDSTFVEVMGEDYPGRVRGMGKGPTPSSYYASTSRSHAAHVKSIEVQQLQSEVQEMRREMKEKDDRVENLEKQVKEKDDRLEKLDPITTIVIHNYLEFLHV